MTGLFWAWHMQPSYKFFLIEFNVKKRFKQISQTHEQMLTKSIELNFQFHKSSF